MLEKLVTKGAIEKVNHCPGEFLYCTNLHDFLFTKVLKPAMASLHCQGIRTITFIDDTLLIGATAEECFHDILTTINLLESLGFHVNYGKSVLTPSQSISYLGFIIDTVSGTLLLLQIYRIL